MKILLRRTAHYELSYRDIHCLQKDFVGRRGFSGRYSFKKSDNKQKIITNELHLNEIIGLIQSTCNGSNIFEAIEICSKRGQFEPLRVNHSAGSGGKWGF